MTDTLTADAPAVCRLTFVATEDGKINFWAPQRHGEYEVDCARGKAYAQELLDHIRDERNPVVFGSVLRAIASSGVYGGAEAGFLFRLGIEMLSV